VGDKLLSIGEVAEYLSVTTRTVHNLLSRGELQGVKVGNRWRFDPEDVRIYLQRQQQQGGATA
jgi:excisionase family DNA binding protein